eukprot:325581_1
MEELSNVTMVLDESDNESNNKAQDSRSVAGKHLILGDDKSKTDRKEIWAWYCYDWANSPFAAVGLGLLIPVLLTDLAEQHACNQLKFGCDINYKNIETGKSVQVSLGLWEVSPQSYAYTVFTFISLIQVLVYIFVAPIADYDSNRTVLFRITSIARSMMTIFYIFWSSESMWQFVGWWTVFAMALHELSMIFYFSWLPILAETHYEVIIAIKNGVKDNKLKRVIEHKSDRLASVGQACGYLGAHVGMILCMMIVIILSTPDAIMYDDHIYGSNNAFIGDQTMSSFSELWATRITSGTFYYSVDTENTFVYFNGLQFIYNGIDGDFYGQSNETLVDNTVNLDFGRNGIDKLIIYTTIGNNHICGFSFHLVGDDKDVYAQSVGNVTKNDSIIIANKIPREAQDSMIFGGINGEYGQLKKDLSVSDQTAISWLSILFVHKKGQFMGGSITLYSRLGLLIIGIWDLVFTVVTLKHLKRRPARSLPKGERLFLFGIKKTLETFRKAPEYPTMFRYLIAYFLFSTGIDTMSTCLVLLVNDIILNANNFQLGVMLLGFYIVGAFGNYLFLYIKTKYDVRTQKMLSMHIACLAVLPIWSAIGLIPASPVGVKQLSEYYIWTFLVALHIGSIQSFSRSMFSQLIPVGHESQMFALYKITDKIGVWIGPLMVTAVSDAENLRWAMVYATLFLLIPLPMIWNMDMDKGRFETRMSKKKSTQIESKEYEAETETNHVSITFNYQQQSLLSKCCNCLTKKDITSQKAVITDTHLMMKSDGIINSW